MGLSQLPERVPVLIVGGGPIGLALAACLGQAGIETLLVERRADRPVSAKMIVVSVRTMEFCRQLGIAPAARDWGFPLDHGLDSVFATSMQGYELGRVRTPPLTVQYDTPYSPERERPCPQTWFDPILKGEALSHPGVTLLYETELETFRQSDEGVLADLHDRATGQRRTVHADYLVGCDGYSSTVRGLLGIEVRGEKHLSSSASIYVDIPGLAGRHSLGEAYRYVFVGEEGVWGVLTTIDGRNLYRFQLIETGATATVDDIDATLRRGLGPGIDYTIRDISTWVRKATVADRFADGRVFLAGDAAHAHPPNGGLGMNTGILDAWNLGWKLAAVLRGWGGAHLLESYDIERRPAAARATEESLRNYHRLVDDASYAGIGDDSAAGARLRAQTGARLVAENERAWHPIGIHLGHVYCPSPIVVDDGTPIPEPEPYTPCTRPGARAPHVWLEPERSTLDLFGRGFSLLRFDHVDISSLERAAAAAGVPLEVHTLDHAEARAMYEKPLVLVRPDGHVAWRGNAPPPDPAALIDRIRGAGPRAAARACVPGVDTL